MYELALFAGAGGGILGGLLSGWRCVGAVECERYPRGVLAQRQNDGHLAPFPIWSDVRSFTSSNNATRRFIRWLRSIRDELIITGGFPCQDISCAGKGAGLGGERSGLWVEFARIIGEIRPRHVLVENSPMLASSRAGAEKVRLVEVVDTLFERVRRVREVVIQQQADLLRILADLTALGYDAEGGVVSAADAIWLTELERGGFPALDHLRERIWIRGTRADAEIGGQSMRRRASGSAGHTAQFCESTDARVGRCGGTRGGEGEQRWRAEVVGAGAQDADVSRLQPGRSEQRAERERIGSGGEPAGDAYVTGLEERQCIGEDHGTECQAAFGAGWWQSEPGLGRVACGVADRVDRLKAIGNIQVPAVEALANEILQGIQP